MSSRRTWTAKRAMRTTILTGFLASQIIPSALAQPSGGNVVAGQGSITQNGTHTQIDQGSGRLIIEWDSFDTSAQDTVRFVQPGRDAIALNRVLSGQATQFDGSLFANGNVIIVNGAGIHFGATSIVDVGGLIASTSDITNSNFLSDRFIFDQPGLSDAMVTNAGTITARDAGLAALVGPGVENSGLIRAELGTVILASGEAHTIDFRGDGLISFAITSPTTTAPRREDGSEADALVENSGTVEADGGSVVMTASQASRVLDTAINMTGVAQANSVGVRNGRIVLGGGGAGRVRVSGQVSARGETAGTRGGTVHVTSEEVAVEQGTVDVSGVDGGGTALIGGAARNQALDPSSDIAYVQAGDLLTILLGENAGAAGDGVMPLASRTTIDADAQIDASSSQGDGGEVIVWGYDEVYFHGGITTLGGDGGFVEVSTIGTGVIDGSAQTMDMLIDPQDVCVGSTTQTCSGLTTPAFILNTTIRDVLNVGGTFTINTTGTDVDGDGQPDGGALGGTGRVLFANTIININNTTTNAGTFIIEAADTIDLGETLIQNSGISGTNLEFYAGTSAGGSPANTAADIDMGGQVVATGGGYVLLEAADDVLITDPLVTSGGNVTIIANGTSDTSTVRFIEDDGRIQTTDGNGGAGEILITADNIVFNTDAEPVIDANGTGGIVTLQPLTNGRSINLGTGTASSLSLTDAMIDRIAAETLRIGSADAGDITVSATISPARTDRLSLISGGNIFANAAIMTNNGTIDFTADSMTLAGALNAGTGIVTLSALTAGRTIDLGTNSAGSLSLTGAELDVITAGTLRIGGATAGSIDVTAAISPANVTTLSLITGDAITGSNAAGADISVANLALQAINGIGSTDAIGLGVNTVAAANITSGSIRLRQLTGLGDLTVGTVDGVVGVSNQATTGLSQTQIVAQASNLIINSAVFSALDPLLLSTGQRNLLDNNAAVSTGAGFGVDLQSSSMALEDGSITAGNNGRVRIAPFFASSTVDLGSTSDTGAALELSNAELSTITAGTLQIGVPGLGDISLTDQISLTNVNTLDLRTSGAVLDGNLGTDITVDNLVFRTGAGFGTAGDAIGLNVNNLAFSNSGGVVNLSNVGSLTIAALDGLTTSSNTGTTTTIALLGNSTLSFAVDTNSTGDATFSAPTITVNNGVNVDVTAGALAFNGATVNLDGNLTAANGITGTATTINVIGSTGGAEIQDAVDVAVAGATVNVGDGTFTGGLQIYKALSLIGDGPTNTTIIDVAANSAGMTVTSSDVTIDGFRFERDGDVAGTVGIRLDGRNGTTGNALSNILIGDTANDVDTIGNFFVDRLAIGVEALGDVDSVSISSNTFGLNDGAAGDQDDQNRITGGIVSRVDRSGNSVIDGAGNVLGQNDQGPFSDWSITDNTFNLRSFASTNGTAIDLEGASGSAVDGFAISGNTINNSTFGIHVVGAGGPGSGSPYPLSNNVLIQNNVINGLVSRGIGIRVGANIDSISPNNDRSRMSGITIAGNTVNNTDTGIDVTGVTFMTMSDIVIDNNTINNADVRGIRLNITGRIRANDPNWTGFVISNNDVNLGANGTGLLIDYSQNSQVAIGSGNTFDGGVNGIVVNGGSGRTLSLVGNTLNDTVFTNQSGNYIELQDTALFNPDSPTIIDATGVSFDGVLGSNLTTTEAFAVENKLVHYLDDPTVGLLDFGHLVVPDASSIQLAVNAAGFLGGVRTVTVGAGTFGGSVEVWVDDLTLVGQGATTIIDTIDVDPFANNGDVDNGFQVAAISALSGGGDVTGVTIQNFFFDSVTNIPTNTEAGIELGETTAATSTAINTTITNNTFNDLPFGVFSNLSDGTTAITSNGMTSMGNGIVFADAVVAGETVTITGNTINSLGPTLAFGSTVTNANIAISSNVRLSSFADSGVVFSDTITDSMVTIGGALAADANDISGRIDGINVSAISGGTFTVANNAFIAGGDSEGIEFNGAIGSGANIAITDNGFIDGGTNGILFGNTITGSQVSIAGNTQVQGFDGDGVRATSGILGTSEFSILSNTTVQGTVSGINIQGSVSNSALTIADNATIRGARLDGITLRGASNSTIVIAQNEQILGEGFGGIFVVNDLIDSEVIIGQATATVDGTTTAFGGNGDIIGVVSGVTVDGITGGSVTIANNDLIQGQFAFGIFADDITADALFAVVGNTEIRGGDGGGVIDFDNGISINSADMSTIAIAGNDEIVGNGNTGILVTGSLTDTDFTIGTASVLIDGVLTQFGGNGNIVGTTDGVAVEDIAGGSFTVDNNDLVQGRTGNGIIADDITAGALFAVVDNMELRGVGLDGITIRGASNSSIAITGNTGIYGDGFDGIFVENDLVDSTVTIGGNGEVVGAENGINLGDIIGGSLAITSNGLIGGTNEDGIFTGLLFAGVDLNISDNTNILGGDDGITILGAIGPNTVAIDGNQQIRGDNNGISTLGTIGGSLAITNNVGISGGANGIAMLGAIAGSLEISGNTEIRGDTDDGILVALGLIGSDLSISTNESIIGGDDGINIGAILGGSFTVNNNDLISGTAGSGIEFEGPVSNVATFVVDNNAITGGEEAIEFDTPATVTNSTLAFSNNSLQAGTDGMLFDGLITDSTIMTTENIVVGGINGIAVNNLGGGVTFSVDTSNFLGGQAGLAVTGSNAGGGQSIITLSQSLFEGQVGAGVSITTQAGGSGITTDFQPGTTMTGSPSLAMSGPNQAIAGNTIENASFNSVGGGNFIVLANGALFEPGRPTIINGFGATFDGVVITGSLESATIDWVESRIIDFDDNPTLGQIFLFNLPYLFDYGVDGPVRVTNVQTPGDWILRPDFTFQPLATNPLTGDYGLGTCLLEISETEDLPIPRCITPAGSVDPSPSIQRFMEGMEQLSALQ